ncbi:hypothetical protein P4O66_013565 [Electrophorus voltai]|uniref:Dendritic cell-specific transmembrane protein-like domain-containing protein n=1 Tax=Electrophorus voltai TaxID=2609070 RepID=A0AAD8Z510_9TELE|nr:hypothetical protein P4O66_013565 [Electrophorus voltai]
MVDINNYLYNLASIYHISTTLKLDSKVDMLSFKSNLSKVAESMRAKMTMLHHSIGLTCLVSKKLIAFLSVLLLTGSSMVYVNGYLTHIMHDNIYFSLQLLEALKRECVHTISAPESSTVISVCVSLIISFFMLMGEVFARRFRHKICASFYHTREEQWTRYLLWKTVQEREKSVRSNHLQK